MTTPKTVLGGDDVHAIVIDCGSWTTRIGSAGDDSPRSIIPSSVGVKPSSPSTSDVVMSDVGTSVKSTASGKVPNTSYVAGDTLMSAPHLLHDIQPVYKFDSSTGDARVANWDAMHSVWRAGLSSLHIDPSTHPLMLVEPSRMWLDSERSSALQLTFEGLQVPSAYIGRGAAMAAFSAARSTACVLDIGNQGATAIPVIDGFAMRRTMRKSMIGGARLTQNLSEWAEACLGDRRDYDGKEGQKRIRLAETDGNGQQKEEDVREKTYLRAHHEVKREKVVLPDSDPNDVRKFIVTDLSDAQTERFTQNHREFYRLHVIDDLKASLLRIDPSPKEENDDDTSSKANGGSKKHSNNETAANTDKEDKDKDKESSSNSNSKEKEKPKDSSSTGKSDAGNGQASAKYCLPDGNELSLDENNGSAIAETLFTTKAESSQCSLSNLVLQSIGASDIDSRRDLFGGLVVVGGTSLIPGCVERLTKELALRVPQSFKLKLHAAVNTTERTCAGWIGGSIVASLGTFQQAWISKQEYDELGADRALRKCP